MACMNIKTFDIYHNDQSIVPDGYVEIDELIAPTIQILNRKGYITIGCCSGHSLGDSLLRNGSEMEYEEKHEPIYCTHIVFKEGISLPTLPPEFVMNSKPIFPPDFFINNPPDEYTTLDSIIKSSTGSVLVIQKGLIHHTGNNFFEISRNILETMEQLYKWATDLPDL